MNIIGIQNPKLIVTNDYQQFLAHIDWFLALFKISDVKPELLLVKLKIHKNGIFWDRNQKKKSLVISLVMLKNRGKMDYKLVFIGGGL